MTVPLQVKTALPPNHAYRFANESGIYSYALTNGLRLQQNVNIDKKMEAMDEA